MGYWSVLIENGYPEKHGTVTFVGIVGYFSAYHNPVIYFVLFNLYITVRKIHSLALTTSF